MVRKQQQRTATAMSTYQLMERFPDEQSAFACLTPILWPDGPVCPYCEGSRLKPRTFRNYYNCADCREDFTIRVGAIAIFAFIACTTAGSAHLQAISGRNLQVNPGIAVQIQSVEPLYLPQVAFTALQMALRA
jgi:hypothetical protein